MSTSLLLLVRALGNIFLKEARFSLSWLGFILLTIMTKAFLAEFLVYIILMEKEL